METVLVLAGVVALAIPIAILVLILLVLRSQGRIDVLEREVCALRALVSTWQSGDTASEERPVSPARAEAARPMQPVEPPLAPVADPAAGPPPIPEIAAAGIWEATRPSEQPPYASVGPRRSPLADWLRQNWVYAVAAASLALAGIFLVQYGMERGLLPPAARVAAALLFGAALVGAGEWVRRRGGDGPEQASAYVPSVLAGAGIVTMFAAVIAARQLYGLIGVEAAFAGLVVVAALAVLLGWFYGPVLAAVGLIGAALAPFAVGGSSDQAYWLYGYFALIAAAGLTIDTMRRWAWLSILALGLAYAGGWVTLMGTGGPGWFAIFLTVLPVLAILIPARGLTPDQSGPMLSEGLVGGGNAIRTVPFPTRLAAGAVALSSAFLVISRGWMPAESLLVFLCLALLSAALIFWSERARALADLAALPAIAFLVRLAMEGSDHSPLAADYAAQAIALRPPETAPPMTAAWLLAMALVLTLLAAWRSGRGSDRGSEYRALWAAASALIAPLAAVVLELFWAPSAVLGAYPWALHVIALAAVMAFVGARFAAADGQDRRRAAYATLSTLSLIALALFLVLTKGALTLALAALVVVAAFLDRRFRLPEMGWFIQAAIAALGWRLVADPGVDWAVGTAQLWEVIAAYGGSAAAMFGARALLRGLDRPLPEVLLGSAGAAFAALFANVLITRWLVASGDANWAMSHWGVMLNALPWLILALTQLYRLKLGGWIGQIRAILATGGGLLFAGGVGTALTIANPMWGDTYPESARLVLGPPLADTLFVAFGLPGLMLIAASARFGHLPRNLRLGLMVAGAALAALYAGFEIRRLWQGRDLSVPGVMQGELYSYTVAMMAVGAALLWQAIARQSAVLRRVAMAVIGVTIAKVFLIDAAGLSGLTRVFSFLALGLSLLALAWLNRWATARQADPPR